MNTDGKTKVIVTGASGLLGRQIYKALKANPQFEVLGLAFSRVSDGLSKLDLCDSKATEKFLSQAGADYIIHAAAERRPDVSQKDPEATKRLNIQATQNIADLAKKLGSGLCYISTDYVFDGKTPPYAVGSETNPPNFYGESKRAGELAVLDSFGDTALILRIPVLFGPYEQIRESGVTAIIEDLGRESELAADHWAIRYPTFTPDVAKALQQILEHNVANGEDTAINGIQHFSGAEPFTRYEMAQVIAPLIESACQISPLAGPKPGEATRPKNCQLDCSQLEHALGGLDRTSFKDAIASLL
ncbi:UNVERIFIED_CONTAM: hypothetical protein GTU68_019996 [Idotea baltica]|nr:hypothetical protein [Idotea baltica]